MLELAARGNAVDFGSTVAICDLHTNEREEYTVVPPDDADIRHHRISSFSPMGRALWGRRAGEIVEVAAPAGTFTVRIEDVRRSSGRKERDSVLLGPGREMNRALEAKRQERNRRLVEIG
jgi:hypothetical protein